MSLNLEEHYWIQNILFINSAKSANVQLPMSIVGALLGRNNAGKTSAVSALKLFLLPEVNFNKCEAKFGFKARSGYHGGQASFKHYFPSDSSFIVCEAENPKGRFCIILHRSNEEWGYSRIVVPATLDDIKHVFWQYDSEANQGFGENHKDLSVKIVREALRPFSPVQLTTSNEICEANFTRPTYQDDLSRFCLIPFSKSGDAREVDALRSLLNLAFDIQGDGSSLAKALATLIESENAGRDGSLDIDIGEISSEYERLKKASDRFADIRLLSEEWETLQSSYRSYMDGRESIYKTYQTVVADVAEWDETLALKKEELDSKRLPLEEALILAKSHLKNASEKHEKLKWLLSEKQERLNVLDGLISVADNCRGRNMILPEVTDDLSLQRYLENEILTLRGDIEALESPEQQAQRAQTLNQQRSELSSETENLERQLDGLTETYLEQLDQHSRSVLVSLNESFQRSGVSLADSQIETIENFTGMFDLDTDALFFADAVLPGVPVKSHDPKAARQNLNIRISNNKAELTAITSRLKQLSSEKVDPNKLKEDKEELEEMELQVKAIGAFSSNTDEAQELREIVENIVDSELPEASLELEAASGNKGDAEGALNQLNITGGTIRFQLDELQGYGQRIESALSSLSSTFKDEVLLQLCYTKVNGSGGSFESIGSMVDDLDSLIYASKNHKESVRRYAGKILSTGIASSTFDIDYASNLTFSTVKEAYEELRAIFDNLNDNLEKHRGDIINHNNATGIRVAAIRSISTTITAFEKEINSELSNYQISNLSSIKVLLRLDDRFLSLQDDLSNRRFSGDQLMGDELYKRLNDFCDEFFKGAVGRGQKIQLNRIIKDVSYRCEIDGKAQNSEQSNGTEGMINCVLLALLMKKIVPASVVLHFPIIFDEVKTLDTQNLRTIRDLVEENNMVLFVAGPSNDGTIAGAIPNWYDLSLNQLTEGDMIEGCAILHHNMTEGIRDIPESTAITEA